jgi:hypothetical protein
LVVIKSGHLFYFVQHSSKLIVFLDEKSLANYVSVAGVLYCRFKSRWLEWRRRLRPSRLWDRQSKAAAMIASRLIACSDEGRDFSTLTFSLFRRSSRLPPPPTRWLIGFQEPAQDVFALSLGCDGPDDPDNEDEGKGGHWLRGPLFAHQGV